MLALRINDDLNANLTKVSEITKRSKSQITKLALEAYLDEILFLIEAKNIYEDKNDELISEEECWKKFNL